MTPDYLNTPLGDLARSIPGATRVFHAHRLDFCCNGHITLAEAANRKQINAQLLSAELSSLQADTSTGTDWQQAAPSALIEHILERYHDVHRDQLPELIRLARRVEQVHGQRPNCPNGLADHLDTMQQELESHMLKEEKILFPMLIEGQQNAAAGPVSVMRFEHDQHGESLDELMRLTNDITAPVGACNTWQALYRGLDEFRQDLMQHIHLENNILFAFSPRLADVPADSCCSVCSGK